jgi:hypothetical protein
MGRAWVLGKKFFSLSLLFNGLLTMASVTSVLGGFYWFYDNWRPFYPYLVDGNLFLVVIVAAAINIFPSAQLGRALHTGRFLFHHYFYGFLVLLCSVVYVVFFTHASLLTLFVTDDTSVAVNVGRFFILGGFTLILDDLPDVSKRVDSALNSLKLKAHGAGKIIRGFQLLTGIVSLYVFTAVCLAISQKSNWITLANFILIFTILITSITSFVFVKRKVWLHLAADRQEQTQMKH